MFYDYVIYKTRVEEVMNEINQVIKTYVQDTDFLGDIQPLSDEIIDVSWGKDIEGTLTLFTDESLKASDVIMIKDYMSYSGTYVIADLKCWGDYSIYLLKRIE